MLARRRDGGRPRAYPSRRAGAVTATSQGAVASNVSDRPAIAELSAPTDSTVIGYTLCMRLTAELLGEHRDDKIGLLERERTTVRRLIE